MSPTISSDAGPSGKLKGKTYKKALAKLQADLCSMQRWVKEHGERIVVVFEGRDTAGKGGVIKRIVEKVSPRVFRVVALPAPNDRERTQFYYQRYVQHLPAAGEVVLFDRSWYNRAGVERVMGFCEDHEYDEFMRTCPGFELALVQSGIRLIKYWLDVGPEQQEERFRSRMTDQKRARLNCIAHLLDQVPWTEVDWEAPELPERQDPGDYEPPALKVERVPQRW